MHDLQVPLRLALQHGFEAISLPGAVPSSVDGSMSACLSVVEASAYRIKRAAVLSPLSIQQLYISPRGGVQRDAQ